MAGLGEEPLICYHTLCVYTYFIPDGQDLGPQLLPHRVPGIEADTEACHEVLPEIPAPFPVVSIGYLCELPH